MATSIKIIGLLTVLAMGLTSPLFSQVPDLTKCMQTAIHSLAMALLAWPAVVCSAATHRGEIAGNVPIATRQKLGGSATQPGGRDKF